MTDGNQLSLSEILAQGDEQPWGPPGRSNEDRTASARRSAEAEWQAAIAAMSDLLAAIPRSATQLEMSGSEGAVVSGPLPVLTDPALTQRLATWLVTPLPLAAALNEQRSLLPTAPHDGHPGCDGRSLSRALPLLPQDPLLAERFCLVATPVFSLGLVLGQADNSGRSPFQYSFNPALLAQMWQRVRSRIRQAGYLDLDCIDQQLASLSTVEPDYRLVTRFSQSLLAHLPHRQAASPRQAAGSIHWSHPWDVAAAPPLRPAMLEQPAPSSAESNQDTASADAELLQAMAHEIRTPLTTIRTLTRSLLRRQDLPPEVQKRLQRIDQECTQQIDRFSLIFRAVELEVSHGSRDRAATLTPIALSQVFQEAIPQWQQQAHRRNLSLDVTLPSHLPRVTSDPTLLHQVLTGVVEWFTQCLPAQSHIQMRVMLAGHQLKLQFESQTGTSCSLTANGHSERTPLRSLGHLLMLAPETGGVSLNLDVTKNLFQSLGGKLIVRQRPQQGDVLTVFLPLETEDTLTV